MLLPRSTDRNTSQGFYCGWNNKTRPLRYAAPYGPFHRAQVLHDYLSTNDDLTFDDVRNLALNIASTDSFGSGGNPWAFVEDYFSAVVNANPTPERLAALAVMDGWDGHFVAGGPDSWAFGTDRADAWVLMDAWIRETIRLTFEDELGSGESKETLFNVMLHGLARNYTDEQLQLVPEPLQPGRAADRRRYHPGGPGQHDRHPGIAALGHRRPGRDHLRSSGAREHRLGARAYDTASRPAPPTHSAWNTILRALCESRA